MLFGALYFELLCSSSASTDVIIEFFAPLSLYLLAGTVVAAILCSIMTSSLHKKIDQKSRMDGKVHTTLPHRDITRVAVYSQLDR